LIPRVDIAVKILGGIAEATAFVNIDASAGLDFTLDAKVNGTQVDGNPNIDFKDVESSFGGSIELDLRITINVGAEAALSTSSPTI